MTGGADRVPPAPGRASLQQRWRRLATLVANARQSLLSDGLMATFDRASDFIARRRPGLPRHRLSLPPALASWDGRPGLPTSQAPATSVIIPAFNQLAHTLGCLAAVADSGDALPFEVIVVDDASSDGTATVLPAIPGLVYVRNDQNLGFIGACNRGAALARGRHLVFLNNDTAVQPGWLDALVRTFDDHPDAGLVGAKLLYPDGRLQEAGGLVYADASAGNYGRFDAPTDPRFNYLRDADYCSGAALAVPAALFRELGGFDGHYQPAYYEDADLAMRVRQRGLRTLYQPASRVVHFDGVTSGREGEGGAKDYQAVNRGKFLARWKDILAADHAPAGTPPDIAASRRPRVLFLAQSPAALDEAFHAACDGLRGAGVGATVWLAERAGDKDKALLAARGIECWDPSWPLSLRGWLRRHGARHALAWFLDEPSRRGLERVVSRGLPHAAVGHGRPDPARLLDAIPHGKVAGLHQGTRPAGPRIG